MNANQQAAQFSLFTLENLPSTHKAWYDENFTGSYKEKSAQQHADIAARNGFTLYFECNQDTDPQGKTTYYIDHTYWIKVSGKGVICMLRQHKEKYCLFPYFGYSRAISYDAKKTFFKEPKEPNKIGVFSEKKIGDWLNYCDAYVDALNEAKQAADDKLNTGQNEINNFINQMKGATVTTHSKRTFVNTSLFDVAFTLHDSGYLEKRVQFIGGLDDIIKLSNK